MEHLGQRIKRMLDEKRINAPEVAKVIGTSKPNMYRLFERDSWESKYLVSLADFLQIPISDFFTDQPAPPSPGVVDTLRKQKMKILQLESTIAHLERQELLNNRLLAAKEQVIKTQENFIEHLKTLQTP
jgi:transcriptional regulator with XRE-family HTH domain